MRKGKNKMNENIETKNKEIIVPAMRKDKKRESQLLFRILIFQILKLIHLT